MNLPIITFEECDTPEKFAELQRFALTFEPPHELLPTKNRLVIAKRDGLWIGYSEIVHSPIVFTAWSKERCKPMDIWAGMLAFTGWARLQYPAQGGYTTVPLSTKTFPERIMNKLGFYRLGVELYRTT